MTTPKHGGARAAARLYLRTRAWRDRVVAVMDAMSTAVWLGLLSRRALQALDEELYNRWPEYSSEEHNRRGLLDWEEEAYADFFTGRRRIVVLAAGAGRETIALAARGHEVRAYECHPELRRIGQEYLRRWAPGATLEPIERDAAPVGIEADAAVIGWSGYTLVVGREARLALLRQLARLLPPGAPILLSFHPRPEGGRRLPWIARVGSMLSRLRGGPPLELGDDLAPGWLHRFTQAEVEEEIRAAGLLPARYGPPGPGRTQCPWAVAVLPPVA